MNNPRDLALLFILIALGMGCGVQLYAIVGLATVFVFFLLWALDFGRRRQRGAPVLAGDEEVAS